MAEQKKGGGFHALEQRIHQMEEEDAKQEKQATEERERTGTRQQEGSDPKPAPRK